MATGTGIGAAISGLWPIVDVATARFIFQQFSQVVNEAANIHDMTEWSCCVGMPIERDPAVVPPPGP